MNRKLRKYNDIYVLLKKLCIHLLKYIYVKDIVKYMQNIKY